jgi:hypothetical protein
MGLGLVAAGCGQTERRAETVAAPSLAGAWRSSVQFRSGAFAGVKDLEFLYAFNLGGTMTESSNYDGAPPVPPAYGIWRETGPHRYEARYEFYATKAPAAVGDLLGGGGWLPAGRGVLTETITLSEDGKSFSSTIRFEAFDSSGAPVEGGGEADGHGMRMTF